MPAPEVVIPLIEGHVGSLAGGGESLALWVKQIKEVMLCGANKDQTDWEFYSSTAVIKTGPDVETGAVLYGLILGQSDSAAEEDFFVADADADGTVTLDGTAALANTVRLVYTLEAATTDGTFEYYPMIFEKGILFGTTTHMCLLSDGRDGTDTVSGEVSVIAVYRTGNTRAQG